MGLGLILVSGDSCFPETGIPFRSLIGAIYFGRNRPVSLNGDDLSKTNLQYGMPELERNRADLFPTHNIRVGADFHTGRKV
jgi:hypothetical protein